MHFDPKFGKTPDLKTGDHVFTRRARNERCEVLSVEKDARMVTWVKIKSLATGKKMLCLLQEVTPSGRYDPRATVL